METHVRIYQRNNLKNSFISTSRLLKYFFCIILMHHAICDLLIRSNQWATNRVEKRQTETHMCKLRHALFKAQKKSPDSCLCVYVRRKWVGKKRMSEKTGKNCSQFLLCYYFMIMTHCIFVNWTLYYLTILSGLFYYCETASHRINEIVFL